ncbi:hypothetical protein DERF_007685 [Dermatophagoides farinae]|uniref:Uncharacterized protein n=1 Tax=Dermatophagoides farinae TaxID=6954 RepID=A0A922I1T5_DERFA|nr:hypothetical protein DERF_007685 [Dermatophagoides farinae]
MENYYFKHPSHFGDMFSLFEDFYRSKTLSDVIINCQGRNIHAHRMVLCAGSDHFRRLLTSIKMHNQLPVLIITDISFEDMEIILEFIYRGQIVVSRDKVESLRQAAYKLRVRGFENFLRKPFNSNGVLNGSVSMQTMKTMTNGNVRSTSLLHESKRYLQQINEMEIKRTKLSHSTPNGNHMQQQDSLYNNNNNHHHANARHLRESPADFRRHYPHNNTEPQSQLEAALQRGLNQMNQNCSNQQSSPNAMMKKMIHFEQLMKSCNGNVNNNNNNNGVYDCNGTLDLKIDKHRQQNDQVPSITITRVNGPGVSIDLNCGNSSMSDSCDENEENQRNETVENNMSGQGNYTNNHFDNSRNESHEVNYTYEMDPSVLVAPQWDNSDENIKNCGSVKEDADGTEEEEYFESMSRNSNSMLDSMFMAAQKMNQMNAGQNFFYCEHCPKYFVDEDHLQLHIKRTHGLNKMNQCNICGKAYAWKSGLYKHKRHVHNIGGTGAKITPNGNGDSDSAVDSQPPTPTDVQQIQSSSMEVINKMNNNNNNNNDAISPSPIESTIDETPAISPTAVTTT